MNLFADYSRYFLQLAYGTRSGMESGASASRLQDIADLLPSTRPWRVLDLANGRLRPQYTLLKQRGHRVFGIDFVNRPQLSGADLAYMLARFLFRVHLGFGALRLRDDTLACGDVGALPYANDSFDLITSIAAFEHFLDVPRVVQEMHRVLRPGGVAWVLIHLFSSPSGGHNVKLSEVPLRSVPTGIDAWDHLRRRRLPFHVPLNEWRRDQYVETFARHFTIVKRYCAQCEGQHLLTPTIAATLSNYDEEELTCSSYVIVARKADSVRA